MKEKVYVPTANENEFVAFGRNTGKTYLSEMNTKEMLINCYGVDEKTAEIVGKVATTSGIPFENVIEELKGLKESAEQMTTPLSLLKDALQNNSEIDDAKRIADLERRKKHCKNYLELKQINSELQELKFNSNVRRYRKN